MQVLHTLRYSNSASFCSQARITFVLPEALSQLIPEEIGTPFQSLSSYRGPICMDKMGSAEPINFERRVLEPIVF